MPSFYPRAFDQKTEKYKDPFMPKGYKEAAPEGSVADFNYQMRARPAARAMLNSTPVSAKSAAEIGSERPDIQQTPFNSIAGLYMGKNEGVYLNKNILGAKMALLSPSGKPVVKPMVESPASVFAHELEHASQRQFGDMWPKQIGLNTLGEGVERAPGRGDAMYSGQGSYNNLYDTPNEMMLADVQRAVMDDIALRNINSGSTAHVRNSQGAMVPVPRGLLPQTNEEGALLGGNLDAAVKASPYSGKYVMEPPYGEIGFSPYLPGIYKSEYDRFGRQKTSNQYTNALLKRN